MTNPSPAGFMNRSRLLESDGHNQLAKGRNGYYLYNTNDTYVGRAIEKYGEYGGQEARFLEKLCSAGDIVIEVGANIGAHTVVLAGRVGPSGHVLAFEPQRLAFQTLCANVALNSFTHVDCYWAALGAQRGSIAVPELDPGERINFGALSLRNAQPSGRSVPCLTLDDFVALPRLKLVKIDVEGMEGDVLRGGLRLIANFKPHLYIENDRVDQSEPLMRLLDGLGYNLYWHTPALFEPDNYFHDEENVFPNTFSFNMLGVHREMPTAVSGATPVTDLSFHPLRR
jgi:FkbM family methyltransferase